MKCPSCNHSFDTPSRFCPVCGVSQTVKCPKCSYSSDKFSKFCPECGTSFSPSADPDKTYIEKKPALDKTVIEKKISEKTYIEAGNRQSKNLCERTSMEGNRQEPLVAPSSLKPDLKIQDTDSDVTRVSGMLSSSEKLLRGWLVCLKGHPSIQGRDFPFYEGINTIGRSAGNTILIHETSISKEHGILVCNQGQLFVEDKNSTNGTSVNSQKISQRTGIRNDDLIAFGDNTFQVVIINQKQTA